MLSSKPSISVLWPIKFPLSTEIVFMDFVLKAWPLNALMKGIISFLKENSASFSEESPMIYKGGATRLNLY